MADPARASAHLPAVTSSTVRAGFHPRLKWESVARNIEGGCIQSARGAGVPAGAL